MNTPVEVATKENANDPAVTASEAKDEVTLIAKKWKNKRGSLIMALHDLQDRYGYVPREAAMAMGRQLNVPLARIYEVLTFYNYFKLKSPGHHVVSVCMGTACFLKGSPKLLKDATQELGIEPGESTADGNFHLQMVRCLGCCGLAPVVMADGVTLGKVDSAKLSDYLYNCRKDGHKGSEECHA
jgi:NADH:ubiquinone oxidoreductase subunit E